VGKEEKKLRGKCLFIRISIVHGGGKVFREIVHVGFRPHMGTGKESLWD